MTERNKTSLVVTSIAEPTATLATLAQSCREYDVNFLLVGDEKSPELFLLDGCTFISLQDQLRSGFKFAELCPTSHYARKNIGYLYAIQSASPLIIETDDDNLPYDRFWSRRDREQTAPVVEAEGWINVYKYFSEAIIWPRGFPLQEIKTEPPVLGSLPEQKAICPIQQGLVDNDPDVDAIYRFSLPLSVSFHPDRKVALGPRSWCPFNSQNTCWWPEAYPLLYLPSYSTFRMTDIWRSFVAQRIAGEYGWHILFQSSDMMQVRNEHDLMRDFENEIPGYLNNQRIADILTDLELSSELDAVGDNLHACYDALVAHSLLPREELHLVDSWLLDLAEINRH